jgi:hypothetical protein
VEYDENGDIVVKLETEESGTDIENENDAEENTEDSVE